MVEYIKIPSKTITSSFSRAFTVSFFHQSCFRHFSISPILLSLLLAFATSYCCHFLLSPPLSFAYSTFVTSRFRHLTLSPILLSLLLASANSVLSTPFFRRPSLSCLYPSPILTFTISLFVNFDFATYHQVPSRGQLKGSIFHHVWDISLYFTYEICKQKIVTE